MEDGQPSWAESSTVFFRHVAQDGWWSIYKINPFDSSSDQGRFAFNLIHPNGTGFHNVSSPGWINHPRFSPDSKSLLFTSDQCHISSSHTVTFLSPRLMALD